MKMSAVVRDAIVTARIVSRQSRAVAAASTDGARARRRVFALLRWCWATVTIAAVPWLVCRDEQGWLATAEIGPTVLYKMVVALVVLGLSGYRWQWSVLSFTTNEVLYLPSKAGLVANRLWRHLPHLLLLGSAWAVALWLRLGPAVEESPWSCAAVLSAVVVSPLLWQVSAMGRRLDRVDGAFLTRTVLAVALWAGVVDAFPDRQSPAAFSRMLLCASMLVWVFGSWIATLWLDARSVRRGLQWEPLELPRLAVAGSFLLPNAWLQDPTLLTWSAVGLLAVLTAVPFALRRLVAQLSSAEQVTARGGAVFEVATRQTVRRSRKTSSIPTLRRSSAGPSVWRADWTLFRYVYFPPLAGPFVIRAGACLVMVLMLARLFVLPAFVGMAFRDGDAPMLIPCVVFFLRAPLGVTPNSRLWRAGVDYRQQLLQNACATACSLVLPTLLLLVAAALWVAAPRVLFQHLDTVYTTGEMPMADRWLLIAGFTACFLLRLGWRGLSDRIETPPRVATSVALAVLAVALMLGLPKLQWPIVVALAVTGAVGLVRRIRSWNEPQLVAHFHAAEHRDA